MAMVVHPDLMLARRKLRPRELADRIGVPVQNLPRLTRGQVRSVRFDTLWCNCAVLQCQRDDLLARNPAPDDHGGLGGDDVT